MKLKAPKEHGQLLAVPALEAFAFGCQALNNHAFDSTPVLGKSLSYWRKNEQLEVLQFAERFTRELTANACSFPKRSSNEFLVTGHQPELFHPGVWAKNFAAAGLAQKLNCNSINLIVDTDLAKANILKLPWPVDRPHASEIAYDLPAPTQPYEERFIQNEALFRQLLNTGPSELFDPKRLFASFWSKTIPPDSESTAWPLGMRFARARRLIEESWGAHNYELPISLLAKTSGFCAFFLDLAQRAMLFCTAHNDARQQYRKQHDVRHVNQPVPELMHIDDWIELPFWIWQSADRQRRRLASRLEQGTIHLGEMTHANVQPLGIAIDAHFESGWQAWQQLALSSWKIRPRALATTLFARLFFGISFIHGLGGALYDEMTDAIIRAFYQMEPPLFLTLTATLLLSDPIGSRASIAHDTRKLKQAWRDVRYNPDRHIKDMPKELQPLVQTKQQLMQWQPVNHAERLQRFHQFRNISNQLQPLVLDQIQSLDHALLSAESNDRRNKKWQSREWAFCIYPVHDLQRLLLPLAKV